MAGTPKKKERKERSSAFIHSPEAMTVICEWAAQGKPLSELTRTMDIPYTTVANWINADDQRKVDYARAREAGADYLAEQILTIADERPHGNNLGNIDPGYVAWQKSRIDARKWIASKLKPKSYGDNASITHKGDAENPLVALLQRVSGNSLPVIKDVSEVEDEDE
jgi:hypothetical protein